MGPRKATAGLGKFTKDRLAWARLLFGEFVLYDRSRGEPEDDDEPEPDQIRLVYRQGAQYVNWNLTSLTTEELLAMKKLFDRGFELALPICQQRDQDALDAFNQGDDSIARLYRQVPQYVDLSRPEPEHGAGVLNGPPGTFVVESTPGHPEVVRRADDSVAEPAPKRVGTQDDRPAPHDPADVRTLGEVADGRPGGVPPTDA